MGLLGSVFDEEHGAAVRICANLCPSTTKFGLLMMRAGCASDAIGGQHVYIRLCNTRVPTVSISLRIRLSRSVFDAEDAGVVRF